MAEPSPLDPARRAELAANLSRTRERITAAARAAGRDPAGITLIAVTKTYPATDVAALTELGVADVGESREAEALAKLTGPRGTGPRRHFIGRLQSNKAASVAGWADVVHSVDRPRLVAALGVAAESRREPLGVLLQVNLDPESAPARGGAMPADLLALAEAVTARPGLVLRGLMIIASPGADPVADFAEAARLAVELRDEHPGAHWLSAGMSGDLEAAVSAGATHVRVGSGLLGRRAPRR